MNVDIVDKYCTDDNNPIKKPTLEHQKRKKFKGEYVFESF
jgi:hypothetical protein